MEYNDLKREIGEGKLASNYFFFGEEPYFIEALVRKIVEKGTDPTTKDFNYDVLLGEEADGKSVVTLASSFPMMAERRVVLLKSVQKLSLSDKKRILEYIQKPLESTCFVLTAGKVDRRQSFYASLVKHSRWVDCKVLYENQAVEWVKHHLRDRGVVLSHEGANFLVRHVGTALWSLSNEIEKLLTFTWGEKDLGLEEVTEVVGFSRKYNTWELTDAVARKDLKGALVVLKRLMEEGQSPVGLIMDISRRIFLLMRIRGMLDGGMSEYEVTKTLHLRPYFSKLYFSQVRGFSTMELESSIKILLKADFHIKTGYMNSFLTMTLVIHDLVRGGAEGKFYES